MCIDKFKENKNCTFIVGFIVVFVLALIAGLIGGSFSYLEYYEMGFKRQKSTGSVDLTKVYETGRHFIGPDFEFKVFPADAKFVELDEASIFTSDKLELDVTINFQYFVRSEELVKLHNKYDLSFEDVMKTSALDAVKAVSPLYTTREFINNRANIETALYKAVRERLGGTCCRPNCDLYDQACPVGCTPYTSCQDSDLGIFVDVKYFQMLYVDIPSQVESQYLTSLNLQAEAERELLLQEASVVRKNTSALVQDIKNSAQEISQAGTAAAALITATANANYTAILETARADGLKEAFAVLGVTEQEYKNSLDYLRTLRGMDKVHLTVDFQQRIVGNLNN